MRFLSLLLGVILGVCVINKPLLALDPQVGLLEKKEASKFTPPEIKVHTFSSGARLYYLSNKELPLVEVDVMIPLGSIHDPQDKKGLLSVMIQGLRVGGTKNISGNDLDLALEQNAMSFDADAGGEMSSLSGKSLKQDKDMLFRLFFDVLQNPAFETSKIEVLRKQMLQALSRRNENPMSVAKREFLQRLFGTQNIWARTVEESTIKAISREDLIAYHQKYFGPKNYWFVVTGDIDFEEAKSKIENFVKLQTQNVASTPEVAKLEKKWEPGTYLIDQQFKQSAVVMGHMADKRFNPDKFALHVANYILGGSTFGSRLGNWIRTSLGLAYGIGSSFGMGSDFGAFQIVASTQTSSTVKLVQEIKKTLSGILTEQKVTPEELATAKQAILNQIIFENEDPSKIVKMKRFYDFYGYPADYLSIYQSEISKVSLDEVQRVLQKYFYPDKLILLIVGDKKGMGDLSGIGPVIDQALDNN